ncbi:MULTISPECIES: tetratricopeptide repeat protein [unclassified Nocardioides]|uniref:tetratricopeptide repeat protein n=1 Tax=unclassified Nocardioides TaxID=2615069 RepID=UPI001150690C|nr:MULTISPECIES: tetratricopeptide repeat protein [unclassified Nocardioides]TQK69143.1 tetratricopeptide repeat protein [Nocardioides sp. SLBN-35]WGY01550.1 tetratricopeptide repeat protein [Nocardioides sp. QY071]
MPPSVDPSDEEALIETGCELAEMGRTEAAIDCFRMADELGSALGSYNLGNALSELGHWPEALAAFERAEAAGDEDAILQVAFALRELDRRDEALETAERAAAAGDTTAAAVVACWRWCTSWDPSLEDDLRAGAELYASARSDLGSLLIRSGRVEEGRAVLERGMLMGEVESMLPLGNLYADALGDPIAAEAAYRAGAELGDAHAHHNLAVLLDEQGDIEGAIEHFRLAAAGGDTLAAQALRDLEQELRDDDDE